MRKCLTLNNIMLLLISVLGPASNGLAQSIPAHRANAEMFRGVNYGNVFDQTVTRQSPEDPAWMSLSSTRLQQIADLYYAKGFRNFRIPFTWDDCINFTTGIIQKDHEKFIKYNGLINYILQTYPDVYVIINSHHDDWYTDWANNKDALFRALDRHRSVL
jgi:hypothetical protein